MNAKLETGSGKAVAGIEVSFPQRPECRTSNFSRGGRANTKACPKGWSNRGQIRGVRKERERELVIETVDLLWLLWKDTCGCDDDKQQQQNGHF